MTSTTDTLARHIGEPLLDGDGLPIGRITQVLTDDSADPKWLAVATEATGAAVVPLAGATSDGEALQVPWDHETIEHAPPVAPVSPVAPEAEEELLEHYMINDFDTARRRRDDVDFGASPQGEELVTTAGEAGLRPELGEMTRAPTIALP
jgi:hypothetical protein